MLPPALRIRARVEDMFLLESQEILSRIHGHLEAWRAGHPRAQLLASMRAEFHALQGDAAAAGFADISELSRKAGRLLAQNSDDADADKVGLLNVLEETHDGLAADLGFVPAVSREHIQSLNGLLGLLLSNEETEGAQPADAAPPSPPATPSEARPIPNENQNESAPENCPPVGDRKLAGLINLAGELDCARAEVRCALKNTRREQDASIQKMRAEWQFDSRDTRSEIETAMEARTVELDAALSAESRLGERLRVDLLGACYDALGDYLPRLEEVVAEAAHRSHKAVALALRGGEIEIHRQVMARVMPPLEQLLCDAIEYRMESPEQREASGQAKTGRICIHAQQQGDAWLVDYTDDGIGLDGEQLRARAVALGMTADGEKVGAHHHLQIIAQPDYDAAKGTGVERIYRAVRDLGGAMALAEMERGFRLQFRLPLTPATQALVVTAGRYRLAILAQTIDRVLDARDDVVESHGRRYVAGEERIPVIDLATHLDASALTASALTASALTASMGLDGKTADALVLIRLAERVVALAVDESHGMVAITQKNSPPALRGVAGAAVLADSSILPILDPSALVVRGRLCDEGLIRFPLDDPPRMNGTERPLPFDAARTKRVVVLETRLGVLLIPASMVAEIVGAAAPLSGEPAGQLSWHGFNVPLIDGVSALVADLEVAQSYARAAILWPMEGCAPDAFFALTSTTPLRVITVDSRQTARLADHPSEATPSGHFGTLQFGQQIGVVPDLKQLARRIFRDA